MHPCEPLLEDDALPFQTFVLFVSFVVKNQCGQALNL